jgi:hypothetical protein
VSDILPATGLGDMKNAQLHEADLRRLYVQAERFRFSDELLRSKAHFDSPIIGAYINLPSIVLCAFSCELYLKCLIVLEGNKALPTHNLKKLFKGLRGKTQKELEALWGADVPARAEIAKLAERIGEKMPEDLRSAINDGANAFDNLRYAYQKDLSKTNFVLGGFPRLLRQLVLQRRPDWTNLGPSFGQATGEHPARGKRAC